MSQPIEHREGTFQAPKWSLFWQQWSGLEAKVPIVLCHGGGEHSGRHAGTAARLVAEGFSVHTFDWPGHGRSPGIRGHIDDFREFLVVAEAFVQRVRTQTGQVPILLGHSLGGLVATLYGIEHGDRVRCLVLSSPLWSLALRVPAWKRLIAYSFVGVWPSLTLRRPAMGPGSLSHDPEVEVAYATDRLVHFQSSLRLYVDARRLMGQLPKRLPQLRIPTLVLAAGDDRIACAKTTQARYPLIGAERKQLIVYPGYSHEILHEVGKDAVFRDLFGWLKPFREPVAVPSG
jgi:alpha-beta hydrolase superfamily lysophospholipase